MLYRITLRRSRSATRFPVYEDSRAVFDTRFPICALRSDRSLGARSWEPIWIYDDLCELELEHHVQEVSDYIIHWATNAGFS